METLEFLPDQPAAAELPALHSIELRRLDGSPERMSDYRGRLLLIVNVASRCGLTPQCAALERLHRTYRDRGFTVLGFPCNQFGAQEPGTAEEIAEFYRTTFDVTFPLFEKIDVNGPDRHPVYQYLCNTPDSRGQTGDLLWNFEKFLVSPDGELIRRWLPLVEPEKPDLVEEIERHLPQA
jgi:glutathione peroxidase